MKETIATEQNQRAQLQDRPAAVEELLKLAAQAHELLGTLLNEPEAYRKAGRVVRLLQFPLCHLIREELLFLIEALSHADEQQSSGPLPRSVFLLHSAIERLSYLILVEMLKEKYPDSHFLDAPEDPDLTSVWREKVRGLLKKCGQETVFSLTPKEYADELIRVGASEEDADHLANWLSDIPSGGLPGLLK